MRKNNFDFTLELLKENEIVHDITGEGDVYVINFIYTSHQFRLCFQNDRFNTAFVNGHSLDHEYNFDMFISVLRSYVFGNQVLEAAFMKKKF